MIANLHPYKGHRDLIEALAGITAALPQGWQMLCAGDGARAELEGLASVRGLAGNIRFLGLCQDVSTLLAAADFGVLPSCANEGFSNAVLESMAASLPMVVTNLGGNAEAVLDGVTGFVVPPGQPQALGAAIQRLAQDPALRSRLGKAGQARMRQEFSSQRCVEAHDSLYRELLASRYSAG